MLDAPPSGRGSRVDAGVARVTSFQSRQSKQPKQTEHAPLTGVVAMLIVVSITVVRQRRCRRRWRRRTLNGGVGKTCPAEQHCPGSGNYRNGLTHDYSWFWRAAPDRHYG